jgi:hypothetical protein
MGQWSQGGMIMIGDMFNQGLKYRVDALCNDLSALLREQPSIHAPAPSFQSASSQSQSQGGGGVSLFASGSSGSWWPADLGQPSSSGAQNDMRYAFFPASRRLAIQQGGRIRVFDTGDHQLGGFSQQQGSDQSLTFTSQYGVVRTLDMPLVSDGGNAPPAPPPQPASQESVSQPPPVPREAPSPSTLGVDEILKIIENLSSLHQKNILSDEEFAAKKAELLGRI